MKGVHCYVLDALPPCAAALPPRRSAFVVATALTTPFFIPQFSSYISSPPGGDSPPPATVFVFLLLEDWSVMSHVINKTNTEEDKTEISHDTKSGTSNAPYNTEICGLFVILRPYYLYVVPVAFCYPEASPEVSSFCSPM
ncbi:hypothetical protein GWI33_014417 [Rhynchophorus ferrugineus]|uniref:Uncharacterized protein n=1 Tax=Rhynchophorus ferrugineus TaxID=354439 RepID=A0A834I776_RHYFE|nr:hypothetical protein GWI33_014417 [Rhynchophorus ferrugineus]